MNIIQTKVFQSSSLILTHPTFFLGRKRRASYEDEEMMNSEPLIEDNVLHITKRNRITSKKDLPIGKLLGKPIRNQDEFLYLYFFHSHFG